MPKQPLPVAAVKQPPSAATAAAAKKVIDVVDLSDDEEGGGAPPAAPVARPVTTVAYTYGPSPATVAGGQTRQILLTPAGTVLPRLYSFYKQFIVLSFTL